MPALLQRAKPPRWAVQGAFASPEWRWAWRGLVFAVLPGGAWTEELIGKGQGALATSGSWGGITPRGTALESTSTSNGGATWPWNDRIASITKDFTIIVLAEPDGLVDWTHLLTIAWDTGWSAPFQSISLLQWAGTSDAYLAYADTGGTGRSARGATGFLQASDGLTLYGGTRKGSVATFYRDGRQHGATASFPVNNPVGFNTEQDPAVMRRSNSSDGEAMDGRCVLALLYNRALTASEMAALARDPFGPFRMPLAGAPLGFLRLPPKPKVVRFRGRDDTQIGLRGRDDSTIRIHGRS